jgi:hypothetical protein
MRARISVQGTNREEIEAELAALDAQYDELAGTNPPQEEAP